jgi:uncharacterized repeat protein (TIGR01451 family)
MRLRPIVLVVATMLGLVSVAGATTTIDRQFGYDNGRLRVASRLGYTAVELPGAVRESRAGYPDLPWISERVELPPGMRVTSVEITGLETRALATGARLAPAIVPTPGIGPIERSKPDPALFQSAAAQPAEVVSLGGQGSMRGHNVAMLRVSPAQWIAATGDVRVVTRVSVRLTLEPTAEAPVQRLRIVPEWEDDGLGTGVPTRELGAALATSPAKRRPGAEPFLAQQLPSVLGSPVAYVIVTSDAMAPVFQQLADWKTQSGVPAAVRTMSFIRTQYPVAADDAERVRLFLRDAYARWGTKWALLGGDTDIIPTRLATTVFYGGELIATDMYFSCLDGNWDADGDSTWGEGYVSASNPGDAVDLFPEIYVGRAPVSNALAAQTFVDKTLQYTRTPLGTYEHFWLFCAEVLFPQPWIPGDDVSLDGGALAEQLLPLTDQVPALHLVRMYENYTDTAYRSPVYAESREAALDSMNTGPSLVLHVGHGYRNVMEMGDVSMTNADAAALSNGNKLFNLYAINCTSAAIDFPCIGEQFLQNPNGGAVTNVGSTRFDFPSTGEAYQYEFFRAFVEDHVNAIGELQAKQKLAWIPYSGYDGVNRWTQMTLILLGDPELRMYLGKPTALVVTPPPSIALSDTQFTVHVVSGASPLAGARVTAYKADDDYVSVLTDGAGDALLPFRPDSVGALNLTVTAYNAAPWRSTVAITPSAAPVLSEGAYTVDDDAIGGTSGDGNGSVNAGETVDLLVPLRNLGGSTATAVTGVLSTTDGLVTITGNTASYGSIASGATAGPSVGYRVVVPYTVPDQRELPFVLTVTDGSGRIFRERFQVTVHTPELRTYSHGESETSGNGDGRAQVGEVVNYFVRLRNTGTGTAHAVSVIARPADGLSVITDSTSAFGDVAPGTQVAGDAITFQLSSLSAKVDLLISDSNGLLLTQRIDFVVPGYPPSVLGLGSATSIDLEWTHQGAADLFGYNVYRSSSPGGPFTLVTPLPTGRIARYTDANLLPLTRYYYQVSAVDSSGNESLLSAVVNASTNPPTHTVFPVPMTQNTPSPVALEFVWSTSQMDIAAGSDYLYVLHADGTPPLDADGIGTTLGDFTTRGHYYASGPSIATLVPGQGWSIIGASWDSTAVYVFDKQGDVRPGWPVMTDAGLFSAVACGDLDGDGSMELVWGSNGTNFYAVHANGTEIVDGDFNPTTQGVFKVLGGGFNYGSPAIADIDGDGKSDVVYGGSDGKLYCWRWNSAAVPGFPRVLNAGISCSPAVAYLDGPGDTTPEIVFAATNDSLYVLEPNGANRPGFPIWVRTGGTTKTPSPAIADLDNDGFLDIVFQSTNGCYYCWNRNGVALPHMWNIRYSTKTSGASESSPVVADIDGDGWNDIILGDENGVLSAFSGATGTLLAGFPIQLAGEIRGTPAVGDIDRDGKTEVLVAGWDRNLYVWDYDFPFQPNGQAPWPQFQHDARRTGYYNAPLFVGVDGPGADAAPALALEFAPPAPNPAAGGTRMWFGIPARLNGQRYQLAIYDLSGRRVRVVDSGIAKAGRFSLQWDLRDENRSPVAGGIYFARFEIGGAHSTRKLVVLQ